MVGLADLKKYTENVKRSQMTVNNKYCYFQLSGLTTYDFLDILNYKSWIFKAYQKTVTIRYVNIIKKLEKGNAIVRTSIGFGPLLLRFLRGKGFQIRDQDIEPYRSRLVVYPDLKINLYDFQERMVQDWLHIGGIGVVKSPTGSGKCCKGNTLILTDRGLIKIEDIVRGISDSKNRDIGQKNLFESYSQFGEKFADDDNIKNLEKVVSISSKLKYGPYSISGKYDMGTNELLTIKTSMGFEIGGTPEHKIIVIDNNGDIIFKKLGDITTEDNVAISLGTNIFNDRLRLNYYYRMSSKNIKNILQNIEYMNEDIATLLGYVVAEGSDALDEEEKTGHVEISNFDEELINNAIRICQSLGINAKRSEYKEKTTGVVASSVELIGFIHFLGYRHGAKNKEVPWSILQADRKSQIAFIRAMFDCDGTVYQKNDKKNWKEKEKSKELVEYYSSSYELCRQLQIMLLNIGIIARLSSKKGAVNEYRGELREYEESYRLSITGGEILKFADIIGFGLKRKNDILDRCIDVLENRDRWTDIVYPNIDEKLKILYERLKLLGERGQIIKTWEEDFELGGKKIKITRKKKISSYDYLKNFEFEKPMWAYISGERYPSKDTLLKLLHILGPTEGMVEYRYLKSISDRFIFDKVENIKKEKDNVYDITIDDVHSYIGNGLVNHNTIVGCRAIKEIGRKTLILVHTSDLLMNVWNDSMIKTFGPGIMSQVGIIGGGLTDADRMAMKIGARTNDFEENVRKDIVIATFQTLNNRLEELSQYRFGLMIVDECIPIDSEIWTKDGIVKYENLGYGSEYKNDVFQVWSRNDDNNVVDNGYKKIKTRFKHMYRTIVETGDELVCSLDHKVLSRLRDGSIDYVEIEKANNIARSLVRPYDMRKDCILARIFGYVLGDGHASFDTNKGHFQGSVSGDYEGLYRMTHDIKQIYYPAGKIREKETDSVIMTIKYGDKFVHTHVWEMSLNIQLVKKLANLGIPLGKKTDIPFKIPDWIMNGDIEIKKEFLGGYFGAEGSNPDFRGNEDNKLRRSFFVNRFSISKRSDLVENGIFFANQIKILLSEFNINISNIEIIDSNIRKDGSISKQILSTIGNNKDNLLRFLDIGYRYCYEKEREGEIIRLYFKYISECDKERKELNRLVIEAFEKGNNSRRIVADKINKLRLYNYRTIEDAWGDNESILKTIKKKYLVHLTEGIVSDILYPHKNENKTEIIANQYRKVLPYNEWLKKVKNDLILLDILRHEYRGYEQGYTLTVNKDHNYLVNGFNVRNCHHVPAKMFRKVNAAIRAPYKMGLSATMKRLDGLEKDVYGSLGDVQSSVSIRELINKGILAEPRFQSPVIVDHGAIDAIETCGHGGLEFSRFVKKTSASSTKKKDYIINIVKNIAARDRKFLLFSDYVHAEDVYVRDMYANALLGEGIKVSIIDQEMSSEERGAVFGFLESGEISGIVFGKLGSEGVNIPSVDVVIMANAIKSPITFTQRVGRVMRKVPGKDFCDVYEILLDIPTEYRWSEYNFAEYKMEGFQKLVYKVN